MLSGRYSQGARVQRGNRGQGPMSTILGCLLPSELVVVAGWRSPERVGQRGVGGRRQRRQARGRPQHLARHHLLPLTEGMEDSIHLVLTLALGA